jgi:putative membrane protein
VNETTFDRSWGALLLNIIVNWLVSAISLLIVANVIRGFDISSFGVALIAAVVIGLVNATVGFILKIMTLPLTFLTLGIFWFVINAIMLKLAAAFVSGFTIDGFLPAFAGAIVLSLVNLILRLLAKGLTPERSNRRA